MTRLKATIEFYIDTAPDPGAYDPEYDTEEKRLQFDLDNEPMNILDASDTNYTDGRTFKVLSAEEI